MAFLPGPVFHAVAFVENLPLKELLGIYQEAQRTAHALSFSVTTDSGAGTVYVYPFGVMAFRDVPEQGQP